MEISDILRKAGRCLYCYDAPCIHGCPAQIDIPAFIRAIKTEDFKSAAKFIMEANCLGGSCSRVCPTDELCEGNCILNKVEGKPVQIAKLQQFVSDLAIKQKWNVFKIMGKNGLKAAVVGAGPAGISCAIELVQNGWDIDIFDSRQKPGGLNTYAISRFKITSKYAVDEVNFLKTFGLKIKSGKTVGKDISFDELRKKYNTVFLGMGLGKGRALEIKGENLKGVYDALNFIEETKFNDLKKIKIGKNVLVIGGGNTALDSAIAAKKIGADAVDLIYRRTEAEMPGFKNSYKKAKLEGVHFHWLVAPVEIIGEKGRAKGVKCIKMKLGTKDLSGRPRPVPVEGSKYVIPCDMVIKGLGQESIKDIADKISGLELNKKGLIKINEKTGMTSIEGIYAGGDCVNGGKEVVHAVREGKIAAKAINEKYNIKKK